MIVVIVIVIIINHQHIKVDQLLTVESTTILLDLKAVVIITKRVHEIIKEEALVVVLILRVAVLVIKKGKIVTEAILEVKEKDHQDLLRSKVYCMNSNNSKLTKLSKKGINHLIEVFKIMRK